MSKDKAQSRKCGTCGGHLLSVAASSAFKEAGYDTWHCIKCGQVYMLKKDCPEKPGIPENMHAYLEHRQAHVDAEQAEVDEYVGQGRG